MILSTWVPAHSHVKPGVGSRFLASARSSPSCCGHLQDEPAVRKPMPPSLSLPFKLLNKSLRETLLISRISRLLGKRDFWKEAHSPLSQAFPYDLNAPCATLDLHSLAQNTCHRARFLLVSMKAGSFARFANIIATKAAAATAAIANQHSEPCYFAPQQKKTLPHRAPMQ